MKDNPVGQDVAKSVVAAWIRADLKSQAAETDKIRRFNAQMGWLRKLGEKQ